MEPKQKPAPLERATAAVVRAAPAIVRAVIEQAKQGSYLHAKFLFDFAHISGATPPTADGALVALLLKELERQVAPPLSVPPLDGQGGEVDAPHPCTVPP